MNGLNNIGPKKYEEPEPETYITGGQSSSGKWSAGFNSRIIVPDDYDTKKYYIAGYHENNPATGLYDPQYVSALYLSDGAKKGGHLLISIDAVGLLNNDVNRIRKSLSVFCENAGISSLSVFCTHDHAGIDTMGIWGKLPHSGKDSKFMSLVFSECYNAAIEAYKSRKEGKLYFGSVKVPGLQEDVRTPVVYSDTLSRFRFEPSDGTQDIYLINFAAHAESLQGCNSCISSDYPGYMRDTIKEVSGADTVFINGAIGGMITMHIENEKELRETGTLLENTVATGEKLAAYALNIKDEKELFPSILYAKREFYIPVENPVLTVACKIGILNADSYSSPYNTSKSLKTEISYYEIGGIKILGVPGELFPELAYGGYLDEYESATGMGPEANPSPLNEIINDDKLLIFGLCNDEIGYILPPNDFLINENAPYMDKATDDHGRRHYEETNSLGSETAGYIADATGVLIKDVINYKQEELL